MKVYITNSSGELTDAAEQLPPDWRMDEALRVAREGADFHADLHIGDYLRGGSIGTYLVRRTAPGEIPQYFLEYSLEFQFEDEFWGPVPEEFAEQYPKREDVRFELVAWWRTLASFFELYGGRMDVPNEDMPGRFQVTVEFRANDTSRNLAESAMVSLPRQTSSSWRQVGEGELMGLFAFFLAGGADEMDSKVDIDEVFGWVRRVWAGEIELKTIGGE